MKKSIGIVADSSAGLEKEDFEKENLFFCPLLINYNDNKEVEDDIRSFSDEDFQKLITTQKVALKTSQTPIGKIAEIWRQSLTKFETIIFIPISQGLSGQYNSATVLALDEEFKGKVTVFNSRGVSIINRLMILKACELAQNSCTTEEILASIQKINDNFCAFFIPYDINYLAKGGRISKAAAALANSLKLKPILIYDGKIDKYETTRTFKKALNKALQAIGKIKPKESSVFFILNGYANNEILNETQDCVDNFGIKNYHYAKIANVVCAHTGLNTIGFIVFDLLPEELPKLQ